MARGRLIVLLAVCGAIACGSQSNAPLGKGDTVYVDVEASTLPDQPDAYLADSPFAPVDGSGIYGASYGDASTPVLSVCGPPDGSASAASDGSAGAARDGSASAAPDGAASGAGAACTAFPAACMSQPDCVCLFGAFAAQIPCPYPSCGVLKDGFDIYCPP